MFLSILCAFIFFVIWDELVINYFWSFNQKYISGFLIGRIPIEEVLFFISVPFACLFLWVNYKKLFVEIKEIKFFKNPLFLLLILVGAAFSLFIGKIYSGVVLSVFFLVIVVDSILKTKLFLQKHFLIFIFGVVNILTFIFNLYLTARPVVIYNTFLKTNINIISIPIEDFIYGMALISIVIIIYEKLNNRHKSNIIIS